MSSREWNSPARRGGGVKGTDGVDVRPNREEYPTRRLAPLRTVVQGMLSTHTTTITRALARLLYAPFTTNNTKSTCFPPRSNLKVERKRVSIDHGPCRRVIASSVCIHPTSWLSRHLNSRLFLLKPLTTDEWPYKPRVVVYTTCEYLS